MSRQLAVELHAGAENCAQAIIKAFDGSEELYAHAKTCGGGRAEDGLCGALYAGLKLLNNDASKEELKIHFINEAKHLKCREIKGNQTLSCSNCVASVGSFLEKVQ